MYLYIRSSYDLIKWYLKTSKLRIKGRKNLTKTLIISELNTSLASVKVNIIYAKCLEYYGYSVLVIFKHRQFLYEQYYKCVGLNKFIYLQTNKTSEKRKIVNSIVKKSINSENFLKLKIDKINIGKWLASRIVRELKVGEFHIENFDKEKLNSYIVESVNAIFTIKSILKNHNNCSILFNERGYSPSGEVFEYCLDKEINTIQWFGSPLDKHHSFKRYTKKNKTYHPLSLSKYSFEYLLNHKKVIFFEKQILKHLRSQYEEKKWFNRQNLEKNKKIYSKKDIIEKLNLNPKKKIAVIFSHVMYDATFFYGESIFKNYKSWLEETLKFAEKNKSINWIIKIHPANKLRNDLKSTHDKTLEEELIDNLFEELPENIFILNATTDVSTYSLFSFIDYGLTVRGTIGCELSCFGIPVFTAGTGRYSYQGFTIDSKNKRDYENKIRNIQKYSRLSKEKVKRARVYSYGSLIARSIPMDGINIKYNLDSQVYLYHTDVCFEKISIHELSKKLDINLFINWFDNKKLIFSDQDLLHLNKN